MKQFLHRIADYLRESDKVLFLLCIGATLLGSVAVLSSTYYVLHGLRQFIMQLIGLLVGLIAVVVISRFDYHNLTRMWPVIIGALLIPVVLTFFIGYAPAGTDDKAWLLLPGGISVQPAEFLKVGFVLSFSWHINRVGEDINKLRNIFLLCLHGAMPVLLIHFQGDDGTALVFAVMFAAMMYAGGLKLRYFIAALVAACAAMPILYFFVMNEDQQARVYALLFPSEDDYLGVLWQQSRGRSALANGGVFGRGLFRGPLVQTGSIPEGYNDFIFCSIGEEMGMIGCLAVIALIVAIGIRILKIGVKADRTGLVICVGTFAMLAGQTIINIGMNLSIIPVIGITLPFFSAGGTSLLSIFLTIGLVMSVRMHRSTGVIYLREDR